MKPFSCIVLLLTLLALAGCAPEQAAPSPSPQILPPSPQADGTPPSALPPSADRAVIREFTMTAKKWEFDPATITVHVGDTVKLSITSLDVAHGFALPDFGVNSQIEPGQAATVEFVVDKAGTFTFFCSVYCGAGHSSMRGTLIVE